MPGLKVPRTASGNVGARQAINALTNSINDYLGNILSGSGGLEVDATTGLLSIKLATDPALFVDTNGLYVKLGDLTEKASPVGGDWILIEDSADSLVKKKVQITNLPSGGGLADVVDDTTPQLGGQLDVNGFALGDGTNELLDFTEAASAVNYVNLTNAATGDPVQLGAAGTDTNIGFVVAPKGNGAIQADTGGNARGLYATDLQRHRTFAVKVASGDYSVLAGGFNCLASGDYSYSGGNVSTASGAESFAFGNSCTSSGDRAFSSGFVCIASGDRAFSVGSQNTASGTSAFCSGTSNTATAAGSASIGVRNDATGIRTFCQGEQGEANEDYGVTFGRHGLSDHYAEIVHSPASFSGGTGTSTGEGDSQASWFHYIGETSDATPTVLTLEGPASVVNHYFGVATDTAYVFEARGLAVEQGHGALLGMWRRGCINNDGGTVALVGTVQTPAADFNLGSVAWSVAFTANNTNKRLECTVTGAAATNIYWEFHVHVVKLQYP